MEKKARMSRTTAQQYEVYLNEIQQNPYLRENKFSADKPDILKITWENLTKKLNSTGGPIKDVAGWKKTFADWKSQVRKRARAIKSCQKQTGNMGTPEKPLTELESKLLFLTGDVIEGLPNVEEVGLANKEKRNENETTDTTDVVKENDTDKNKIITVSMPVTNMPNKKGKGKQKTTTILSTFEKYSEAKCNDYNELRKINENLQILIEQNKTKIWLTKKKMELKYNVTFEDFDEDDLTVLN